MAKRKRWLDDFSHVRSFTGYMEIVVERSLAIGAASSGPLDVLDIPAGSGLVADRLRAAGHRVTCADFNDERPDFVRADMSATLPFADRSFDLVLCLEGIEHVVDGVALLSELVRVLRPGGHLILTTPNVMNLYSRWYTLWRGYPFQFEPSSTRHVLPGQELDRGHVNPMSYLRLRYVLEHLGADTIAIDGDRAKRKLLVPFLWPIARLGTALSGGDFRRPDEAGPRLTEIRRDLSSRALLLGRSLVLVARRR
jgi:SAM-dependent methyltransferase